MAKFNVMVISPREDDNVSLWRLWGPISRLRRMLPDVDFFPEKNVNWCSLSRCDLVLMQRPYSDEHLLVAEKCEVQGKPLWTEYDDNLFDIPVSNKNHDIYSSETIHNNLKKIASKSTYITASTKALYDIYNRLNPGAVTHIPNAWDEKQFPTQHSKPSSTVVWRGSCNHDEDLDCYTEEITELVKKNGKTQFVFIGKPFWRTMKRIDEKNVVRLGILEPIVYMKVLQKLNPRMVMVPLKDNVFNHCKSNISWLEATYAGAICVAPDWDEWQRPGILNYTKDFFDMVDHVINHPKELNVQKSRNYIAEHLRLKDVNQLRANIIRDVMNKS